MAKKDKKLDESVPKNKGGRPSIPVITPDLGNEGMGKIPPKPIDLDMVYHWIDIGATAVEIAGSFRISVDTLDNKLKQYTGLSFSELKQKTCGGAKIRLRQNQFNLAENNAAMSIWLGKNLLGQLDDSSKFRDDVITTFTKIIASANEEEIKKMLQQTDKEEKS